MTDNGSDAEKRYGIEEEQEIREGAQGAGSDRFASGSGDSGSSPSTDEVLDEFDLLRAELEQTRDRYLRQAAEFQNFRKRTALERETLVETGKVLVVERMLEILDDLDRTLGAVTDASQMDDPGAAYESLKQGVELVHRKFSEELSRFNVSPIDAVGQPFDEHLHDAMMQQPAPDGVAAGTVLAEIQKGYRMGDRVLRHSKVVVAQ